MRVGLLAGGFTVVAAPFALSAAGFTAGGIGAGSVAAQWMSLNTHSIFQKSSPQTSYHQES